MGSRDVREAVELFTTYVRYEAIAGQTRCKWIKVKSLTSMGTELASSYTMHHKLTMMLINSNSSFLVIRKACVGQELIDYLTQGYEEICLTVI